MLHKLGPLRVTSTLPRYKRNYFVQQGVTFEEVISPMISATLDLYAVDDPVITPDSISIFNHPSNKVGCDWLNCDLLRPPPNKGCCDWLNCDLLRPPPNKVCCD